MALSKPSITELMQMVKASIKQYRADQAAQIATSVIPPRISPSPLVTMANISEEIEYSSRTVDQEVDTVAICPLHPDYMIIGTYSLLKKDEPCDYNGQKRRGSLQVATVMSTFKPRYVGMLPPSLDRVDFPCAVLDTHFHPSDSTLLGVATSNATVHLFRFTIHGDVLGRRVITKLLPLGTVRVANNDEHGLVPLLTQFTWFPETRTHGVVGISDVVDVGFAATTSFGDARVVRISVPAVKDLFDERADQPPQALVPISNDIVHSHELEAWTVAVLDLGSSSWDGNRSTSRVILSGGDDSALVASSVSPSTIPNHPSAPNSTSLSPCNTLSLNTMPLWRDRRSHTAGVVSILPLPPITVRSGNGGDNRRDVIPLATGSYDEYIRLFEIDTQTYRASFKTELRVDGGVWRLKVLDQYSTRKEGQAQLQHHTLVLASLMHAGAAIIRITRTTVTSSSSQGDTWTIAPVTIFRAGHESMVYCCDARLEDGNANGSSQDQPQKGREQAGEGSPAGAAPAYTIVSSSFYDMKICTWRFVDHLKAQSQ